MVYCVVRLGGRTPYRAERQYGGSDRTLNLRIRPACFRHFLYIFDAKPCVPCVETTVRRAKA